MTWLLVAVGAAVGASTRYLVDRAVRSRHDGPFPWGTVAVNVVGSLVLGLVVGAALEGAGSPEVTALLGSGFCGALTTYSTFSAETLRLVEDRHLLHGLANAAVSIGAGVGAAALGVAFARSVWSVWG